MSPQNDPNHNNEPNHDPNDWFEAAWQTLDRMAETLSNGLIEAVETTIATVDEATEQLSNQINDAIAPEWVEAVEEQFKTVDKAVDSAIAQTEVILEQTFRPVNQTVSPVINSHETCIGCKNYEGSDFGGNMLVCGIHPYGCDTEKCPDWESTWPV